MNPFSDTNLSRRDWIRSGALALGAAALPFSASKAQAGQHLPQKTTFIGKERFDAIMARAVKEGWGQGSIGDRIARFGWALRGIPYVGYTLEIDDRVESPSVNFHGLDCWTFFEVCLGMARMMEVPKAKYSPDDLLAEIEWTRYRGGVCHGNYLDRIHYLAEWYFDNEARGNIRNLTRQIGAAQRITGRRIEEMTVLWRSYRYLKNNPDLRPLMKRSEDQVAKLPVYFIPKERIAEMEPKLNNGDIIGIATKHHGGFCSHVGLAMRTKDGVTRFLHASSTAKQVYLDKSISQYCLGISKHAGILVGRALPRSSMVTDQGQYQANLRRLIS